MRPRTLAGQHARIEFCSFLVDPPTHAQDDLIENTDWDKVAEAATLAADSQLEKALAFIRGLEWSAAPMAFREQRDAFLVSLSE